MAESGFPSVLLTWLPVGLGGFVGAVLRYAISSWAEDRFARPWPLGTLLVNVAGCLLIGAAMAWVDREVLGPQLRLFLVTGVLGALTTFSTFSWDTLLLARSGRFDAALVNVAANTILGLGAATLGFWLTHRS